MVTDIKKTWDSIRVDCPSTTVPALITILHGGESITLKSMASNNKAHDIGNDRSLVVGKHYKLERGETLSLTLPVEFGRNNFIEIWALPETAGDDVCYVKLTGLYPKTEAST